MKRSYSKHHYFEILCVGLFVLVTLLAVRDVGAAPNFQINYQGKLTTASNVAVPNGTYNMRFWLLASSTAATSTALWSESYTGAYKVTVTSGLFSVMLGASTTLTGVDFNQTLYLGVEIGSSTANPSWDGEMSPRKVLGVTPAAFEADRIDGLTSTQFLRSDTSTSLASSSAATLLTLTQSGAGDILNVFDAASEVFTIIDGGRIGIGSTTPTARFSIMGTSSDNGPLVSIASSSGRTLLTIGTNGQIIASSTATSTFANGINIESGCFAVNGVCVGGVQLFSALADVNVSGAASGSILVYNGSTWLDQATSSIGIDLSDTRGVLATSKGGTGVSTLGGANTILYTTSEGVVASSSTFVFSSGRLGVGTTTPTSTLDVYGNLTVATGSVPALVANAFNNRVGINTSNPQTILEVVGDISSRGLSWATSSAAEQNGWASVSYGNNIYVSVANTGTSRVMYSPDGINWRLASSSYNNAWSSVAYGNGLFVAVSATTSTSTAVMTSPDGINWTARSAAAANSWNSVTYGKGLFVAVAYDGSTQVMTSPDGITWTGRNSSEASSWNSVTYGNGLFVAVSGDGTNQVMTSSDGIVWSGQAEAEANYWYAVTYGNGKFVAVSQDGTNRVMYSLDGVTWTSRTAAEQNQWSSISYGNGNFVALSQSGTNRVMTSPDGLNWKSRTSTESNSWNAVGYGNGRFVAVAGSGTNRVMISGKPEASLVAHNNLYQGGMQIFGNLGVGTSSPFGQFSIQATQGSNPLIYVASSTAATSSYMYLTSAGKLGLGTSSPLHTLTVHGDARITKSLYDSYNTAGTLGQVLMTTATGTQWVSTTTLGVISSAALATLTDVNVTGVASGSILMYDATSGTWLDQATSSLGIDIADTRGTLAATRGGTGLSTITTNQLLIGAAGNTVTQMATSSLGIDISDTRGILATSRGGTGVSNLGGANTVLYTTAEGTLASSTSLIFTGSSLALGSTTPQGLLTMQQTSGLTGNVVAGMKQFFNFTNSTESALYYGNNTYIVNTPTATSTLVGSVIRVQDNSGFGNTIRGLEVQTGHGTTTQGENTALSGFARTFGVRGSTNGTAGSTYLPAGVLAETTGTTQGNALRAYSGSITTEDLVSFFHDTSDFTGTGLLMNFGNAGGSFATSSNYVEFQRGGTTVFKVSQAGSTTIGDGTTNNPAGLMIGYGGLCVDNDGTCHASTTGKITSVSSALSNSDLAEMYFSSEELEPGDIVYATGIMGVGKAREENRENVIGVVSTKPGITLGFDDSSIIGNQSGYPIALSGRVPIRLSTENGPIKVGDKIMLSSIPGVGMKADGSGLIVGVAIEDFDGEHAYSLGFINQFGDDIAEPKFDPEDVNDDSRTQDGCYYGGGSMLGEETCDPEEVSNLIPKPAPKKTKEEAMQEALLELADEEALSTTTSDGQEVTLGQSLMFVNLSWHQIAPESAVFAELLSTSTLENGNGEETLWDRIKVLAGNFVDGVLTLTGIKTDRVETKELCVDDVCVTADDLRALLNNGGQSSSGGSSAPSGSSEGEVIPENPDGSSGDTTDIETETGGTEGENSGVGSVEVGDGEVDAGAGDENTAPAEPEEEVIIEEVQPDPQPEPEPEPEPANEPSGSESPVM